ncbi:hypothetical protein M9M90_16675 [Phenylobacterium sp. LH3H17]|uniref:hypothetical protein n=1 Tax=Phenylobacterium sp. LH3H17 TaxID=2903901 RepID=UPI0020C9A86D|nr:hypothetical protein [Phenylobacterium sp. LH3H17]UTP38842.1 hypothetical protein M9M90_16675 [Phenylobacterium sp. LH3H17]
MTARLRLAALALAAAFAASSLHAEPIVALDAAGASAPSAPFTAEDLVLLEVRAGDYVLTDALDGYAARSGVFVPLGQLSRLLDLAIVVSPPDRRAEGWALSPDKRVQLDLAAETASAGGETFRVDAAQAVLLGDEIYVRTDLLERLLPLKAKADIPSLSLTLVPLTPLPFQERLARESKRKGLDGSRTIEAVLDVATPYELFTPPSADLNLNVEMAGNAPDPTTQYQLRLAGDLFYAGAQLYAGSDSRGELSDVRMVLERKDPEGGIGPLHLTRAGAGDVFTPALAIGARGAGGRGVYMTSEPLEQPSVLGRIDVRGELELGWDVELYLNELLQGSQATPVGGRYEFPEVPLSYGLNTLRLVFYGPRGERREEVRRLNFGGGLLPKGRAVFRFGAVEEGVNLIKVGDGAMLSGGGLAGQGQWRVLAGFDYGLATNLSLSTGYARYTPAPDDTRQLLTTGVRTSVAGVALIADGAVDGEGGAAVAITGLGRARGVSYSLRHAEYGGGFVDETQSRGSDVSRPLARSSELRLDGQARLPLLNRDAPASLSLRRDQLANGDTFLQAAARASTTVDGFVVATNLAYTRDDQAGRGASDRLTGGMDASGVVADVWRVRVGVDADLAPELQARTAVLTLDREFGQNRSLRLGLSHAFGDDPSTGFQAAATWRLSMADVTVGGGYDTGTDEWRIGFQLSTGLLFDPLQRRYRPARPGAAAGGNVALLAFVDENGDGVAQPGERRMPGLKVSGGYREEEADALGRLVIAALGDGAYVRLRVDPESVDDAFMSLPPTTIQFTPRPGRVAVVEYGMRTTSEVELRMLLRDAAGGSRGLSALGVQLVDAQGTVVAEGRTEYDGALILEGLPAGAYEVRLDPQQSARLRMSLEEPVTVQVGAGGGFLGTVRAYIKIN